MDRSAPTIPTWNPPIEEIPERAGSLCVDEIRRLAILHRLTADAPAKPAGLAVADAALAELLADRTSPVVADRFRAPWRAVR